MYPTDFKYTQRPRVDQRVGFAGTGRDHRLRPEAVGGHRLPGAARGREVFKQGEVLGTIESVKAVSEVFSPVSGEVVEVNSALADKPEAVNQDAHASWMVVLKLTHPQEVAELLDSKQYAELAKRRTLTFPTRYADIRRMLDTVGVKSVDDLFAAIPPEVRF